MSKLKKKNRLCPTEPFTHKLKKPIPFGSELISELTFRIPTAKDLRRLPIPLATGDLFDLAGRLSNQPRRVMDVVSAVDYLEIVGVMSDFFADGQATGKSA